MDPSRKSNKISDIVRLQQMLKKWKKLAKNGGRGGGGGGGSSASTAAAAYSSIASSSSNNTTSKSIKFLKRTLSFTDVFTDVSTAASGDAVPKGFLAVCVGKELKRFVIPTEYLTHQAFRILLQEAEEEFGFQQEGVLKIPCEVSMFEKILKAVEEKRDVFLVHDDYEDRDAVGYCTSADCELTPFHHAQMCS